MPVQWLIAAASWTLDAGSRISLPRREPVSAIVPARTSIFDLAAAESWCTHASASPAHLQSVYRHLFRRGGALTAEALHSEAGLPRQLASGMCSAFVPCSSRVVERVESAGGRKLVVELASGLRVETVLIMHEHLSTGRQRCTVCVSSQVGCGRQCSFCATGTMGALAQLSAAEILEQVWHARQSVREDGGAEVRNVVFMGMGEPLDNLDAVLSSLRGMTHQSLFDLGARRITVSTVGGSAGRIMRLADEAPRVRLALSLHAATQQLREELIPSARAVPLDALGEALDYHARETGAGACLEYLLIAGLNDQPDHADALAAFCRERKGPAGFCNLIPYNPTSAGALHGYETPSDESVAAFHARLREVHGVHALVRWSSAAGRDAAGACGQLVVEGGRSKGEEIHPGSRVERYSAGRALPT
mmetsp:Transcript_23489/g.75930  ORF Transcript_23489/g.75930 Transcript_23489/m.75930 type:complete len:419 (+) Transcript_23489:85-1341(+)